VTDEERVDEAGLERVFRSLQEHGVRCAVVGAVALGLHGLARTTADIDLFIPADRANVERLKAALRALYDDPCIDQISADDLCGDYPAVRYVPPEGFGFDILTRLGEAFTFEDLEVEDKVYGDVVVPVVTARTLWLMKRDTVRPRDRLDAAALAERFGFQE